MKVVALVSGGKDSCYNMQLCQSYGHEIVALANLLPLNDAVDELDSFMYQTVGHQVVAAFAQCIGLPLFRRRIIGSPRTKDLRYRVTEGDEVEDLEILLRAVKRKIPSVGGVSTGAIASDYQRLRVENVCSRLGLVSLAYMWKQDQATLLQDMIDSGLQAVLVKVAAMGLIPNKHLGKDLATLQPLFWKLQDLYGCNVCGEGGEYESLTLDCSLFKNAKIVLDEFTIQLHSPDTIAPVGVLHPAQFHLEYKSMAQEPDSGLSDLLVEVTDNFLCKEDSKSGEFQGGLKGPKKSKYSTESKGVSVQTGFVTTLNTQRHGIVAISCLRRIDDVTSEEVQGELSAILGEIERNLLMEELGWAEVLYVHLYLNDMKDFMEVNEMYKQHITEMDCIRGVPSRCCVELPLGQAGIGQVAVEILAARDQTKKVLHVQSISSWAPSCIGPYSQATQHQRLMYMAGQIGLDPPTMNLVTGGATCEMTQALQNCEAVGEVFTPSFLNYVLSFTVYCASAACTSGIHHVEDVFNKFLSTGKKSKPPGIDCVMHGPLVLYILLPELPKGALVEVAPLTYIPAVTDEDLSDEDDGAAVWQMVSMESFTNGQRERSLCTGLVKRGCLCRALLSMSSRETPGLQASFNGKAALYQGFQLLSKLLLQSSLVWEDVFGLRLYFVAAKVSAADVTRGLGEILETFPVANVPQPAIIPVLGVGETTGLLDVMVLELTASGGP